MSVAKVNSANLLTAARLVAIVPILIALEHGRGDVAFWLFCAAALTDAADGFVAKRLTGRTPLGAVLDPVADKLLLATLLVALALATVLPLWLVGLCLARDLAIVTGALTLRLVVPLVRIRPSRLGKSCTVAQLALVGCALSSVSVLPAAGTLLPWLGYGSAALTVASGAAYGGWGIQRLRAAAA